MPVSDRLAPLLAFLQRSDADLTQAYDRRFCNYMRGYGHPVTFLEHQQESFGQARMSGQTVLDLGCGFGIIAAAFALLGAKKVMGVDLDGSMIVTGNRILDQILPPEVRANVEISVRDILKEPFAPASFDVVATIESLSHIQSVEAAITAVRAMIRPGGRVLVSDGNNLFYLPGVMRRRAIWRDVEAGEYGPLRESIIKERFPNLSADQIKKYGELTQGHVARDIIGLVEHALATGQQPTPIAARRMMNPLTQYYAERELDPFELMTLFREEGFLAQLLTPHSNYPPSVTHPKRWLKRSLTRLYPLTFAAFPGFRLLMTEVRTATNAAVGESPVYTGR